MKKYSIQLAFLCICVGGLLYACSKEKIGHECRWEHCPYKGVKPGQYEKAVEKYTECDEGTDCYYIDILHLEYPTDEYDQLEEKLFKWGGEPLFNSLTQIVN